MIKRLENEIWTSYIARSLELEGVEIGDFKPCGYDNAYAVTNNDVLTLERRVAPEDFSSKYIFLYDTFSMACLQERAFINFIPTKEAGQFEMEFLFSSGNTSIFRNLVGVGVDGLFSKYQDGEIYDSYKVVQDLIDYAKDPTKSMLLVED
jgi:hypothetical protein